MSKHLALFPLLSSSLRRSPLLSPSVSIFTSWCLACSPALRAGVWGLYIGAAACLGDSIAPCVCVSVSMCMCRMKCRLPPMRHTRRHTCTCRGGGCCVRTEGTVGVLSELDQGFYTSQSGRYGIVEYCCSAWVYIRVCVCVWGSVWG